MKTLQRTSRCQHSRCCLLAVREHLPLLILETLLRHVLRSCLLRLLLRHLFSYADVKKKKAKQVAHASGDNEATQSFEQTRHPLDEVTYNEVYEIILQQLMETDKYDKLRVWTSDVEKRDVYLTAKKTSPCMEEGDHAQDCGRGHDQGNTGEVHW